MTSKEKNNSKPKDNPIIHILNKETNITGQKPLQSGQRIIECKDGYYQVENKHYRISSELVNKILQQENS